MELDFKIHCLEALAKHLSTKKEQVQSMLDSLKDSRDADQKSSAGDKHETGRARIQEEMDMLSKQLHQIQDELNIVTQVDSSQTHKRIGMGSLVKTEQGLFLLSVSAGKMQVDGSTVFALSPISPLGKILNSRKLNESFRFRNQSFKILDLV